MSIKIHEKFQVQAPPAAVWQFMISPQNVIGCMPGATLTAITDAQQFLAAVKVKLGALNVQYQGKVTYLDVDPGRYALRLRAEGVEHNGGTVQATIDTQLVAMEDGAATEVTCDSNVELTGRIVQVGRGMIEGVAKQIIKLYVSNVKAQLEPAAGVVRSIRSPADGTAPGSGGPCASTVSAIPAVPPAQQPINALLLLVRMLWDWLRRALGRTPDGI